MAEAFYNRISLETKFPKKDAATNLARYNEIRSDLQTGDLFFFSGDHWMSGLIRWRSRSAWSHVGLVIRIDELQRVFLVESIMESGVRMTPISLVFSDYDGHHTPYNGRVAWARHATLHNSPFQQNLLREYCLDNLTKQYDRGEYKRILWRTFIGSKELFHDDKFTCAEFAWEAFKAAGIKLPKERGYFISPGAFWRQDELIFQEILI